MDNIQIPADVQDQIAYIDGAQHAADLIAEGYDAATALSFAVSKRTDWDRGYIDFLSRA